MEPPRVDERQQNGSQAEAPRTVASVVENRAREVGIAVLDLQTMRLGLQQLIEQSRSYVSTMSTLLRQQALDGPVIVVGSAQAAHTGVNLALEGQGVELVPLQRRYFDDTQGLEALRQFASRGTPLDGYQAGSYLMLGAAGALIRHLQEGGDLALAPHSLALHAPGPSHHHVQIDAGTAQSLELVAPLGWPGARARGPTAGTLYGFLNATKTRAGAWLLRSNLLQPLRDVPTLNLRYEALGELLGKPDLLFAVRGSLAAMPPQLDRRAEIGLRVCGDLVLRPAKSERATVRRIAAMIQSAIQLRRLLAEASNLAARLAAADSTLLQAVAANAGAPEFKVLLERLEGVLEEDVTDSSNAFLNRTQQCFAVKKGADGFLEVARETFCRATKAIHELVGRYAHQYGRQDLKAKYSAAHNFCIAVPARRRTQRKDVEGGEAPAAGRDLPIPPEFVVLQRTPAAVLCTTTELNALNARLAAASNDCLVLTDQVLEGVVEEIVASALPALATLVDGVALLDMLAGWAVVLGERPDAYVRPALGLGGPTAIVGGRHPLLGLLDSEEPQPNDTYLSEAASFHVITGPNMSGKSTYLRQVALIVIMAQVGCYVPACFCSLSPVDWLFSRIGTCDCLETNSSSFMVEMQETAHILHRATPSSLVLIDELGRATSTADGIAVAWAVSEALIDVGAKVLFATHFAELAELAAGYPTARAWHMAVDTSRNRLDFKWRLEPGKGSDCHYGLLLAEAVGMPADIISVAGEVARTLTRSQAALVGPAERAAVVEERAACSVAHKLACLAAAGLEGRALLRQLVQLRRALAPPQADGNGGGERAPQA